MANYTLKYTGAEVDNLLEKIDTAFGEETIYSDTITWDGNTDGLYSVLGMFYKVSEAIPTLTDLQRGGVVVSGGVGGGETAFTSDHVMAVEDLGAGNDCIVIMQDGNPVVGVALKQGASVTLSGVTATFEETGVFLLRQYIEAYNLLVYISKLVINDYAGFETTEIKTIDSKFIAVPRTYFYGTPGNIFVDEEKTKSVTTIDMKNAYEKGQIIIKSSTWEYLVTQINFTGYPMQTIYSIGGDSSYTIGSLD